MSTTSIINQIKDIKARVANLDNSGRVFYEIWGFFPASSSEYQNYGKGSNRDGACYPAFESQVDTLLSSPDVAKIKITLKDSRKDLGGVEITIKPAYQNITPSLVPMKVEKAEVQVQQPQQSAQPQTPFNGVGFLKLLGFGEMLNGTDDDFGGLGSVLAIRDKLIENRFEQRDKEREMGRIIEENAVLKHQNKELESKIEQLNGEIDNYEDSIGDLEDEIAEYQRLNPKRDLFSGLLGMVADNTLTSVASKAAGLFGLNGTQAEVPAPIPATQPVQISEVDDSPRSKAKQQITAWIDTLGDCDFSALYQLLTALAKGASITSCLQWATQPTPASVSFDEDE